MTFIKVKKLNENKITISISLKELEKRNISLNDLKNDSKKARNLFISLIKESNLDKSFIYKETELFIEATTENNNILIITITKLNDFKNLDSYNLLKSKKINILNNNIFIFNNLNDILKTTTILKKYKLFIGKNTLYSFNNNYILLFSKYSITNYNFIPLNNLLLEYSKKAIHSDNFELILQEKGNIIISNKAIQTLIKI